MSHSRSYTRESLLSFLEEHGVACETYEHPVVMTVEEQAKHVGDLDGGLSKNLFLKDKKNRLYVVSALTSTHVDLEALSVRLGLGKGGLRMASEESLQAVLQVPLGCVTPFALINDSARSVSLLLDIGFQKQARVFFHPLTNSASTALTTEDLDKFLKAIGREPSYVDLEEELEGQVADVPFELLQQARSNGQAPSLSRATKQDNGTKRANKNRPMEMSSKKPVGRFREVIQAPKREVRDPRFESLCGKLDDSRFKKSYSFLYDEELPAERQRLKKDLAKGGEDVEEAQKQLAWIDKELREEQQRRKRADAASQHGSKEREAVKKGKKPFYLKKSEQKKEELVEKYQDLKASGKLDKFLEKRRKKNSAKDHRYLPYRRPQA